MESAMKIGFALGNIGPIGAAEAEQIKEDIAGCRQIGAHEVFFDPTFMPGAQSLDRWLALMEQVRELV
jgi:hypothetical protein